MLALQAEVAEAAAAFSARVEAAEAALLSVAQGNSSAWALGGAVAGECLATGGGPHGGG